MRRRLNPWVTGSVGGAFVAGAFIGWVVTRLGCDEGTCTQSALVIAAIAGFVAAFGVGIVVVLADRSLRESRAAGTYQVPDVGSEPDEASSP